MADPIDPLASYLHKEEAVLTQRIKTAHPASDEKKLSSAHKMLKFLDQVPEKYKSGPWHPLAHMVLFSYALYLVFMLSTAVDTYLPHDYSHANHESLQTYRLLAGCYGLLNTALTLCAVGVWPLFASYTLTSWNLMTVRFFSAYLAGNGFSACTLLANLTRFPALVGCTITVTIWWGVLVPMIHHLLRTDPTERKFFWDFNLSFTLINVHLLNLPMIGVDFWLSGHRLHFFDLYCGLVMAFVYCLFYLNILDPRGLHFYIILTPRSRLCVLSYGLILLAYFGIYQAWNSLLL